MRMPLGQMILIGAGISFVVVAVRFIWIFPTVYFQRRFLRRGGRNHLPVGTLVVASWAGMRGVVSMAAALALPLVTLNGEAFPHRHIILFLTFCVIFVTLVVQGLTLPWIARKLKVEEPDLDFQSESKARVSLLQELIKEVDELIKNEAIPEYRESLELWKMHYQDRIRALKGRLSLPKEMNRYAASRDGDLLPKLMDHARHRLAKMRRTGEISEEVRRRIEQDLDMEEQKLKRFVARAQRDL
jgi:NhaP-type Na+/H+ or K+/H+ antiporter